MCFTKEKHFHYPIPLYQVKFDDKFKWIANFFSSFWNVISFIHIFIFIQWIQMTFQRWLKMLNETKEHPQYLQKLSHYYQIYHF